jgi:hypothetical protein
LEFWRFVCTDLLQETGGGSEWVRSNELQQKHAHESCSGKRERVIKIIKKVPAANAAKLVPTVLVHVRIHDADDQVSDVARTYLAGVEVRFRTGRPSLIVLQKTKARSSKCVWCGSALGGKEHTRLSTALASRSAAGNWVVRPLARFRPLSQPDRVCPSACRWRRPQRAKQHHCSRWSAFGS